ncbi:MAG TPA: ABC transporter substrate-binding protein [Acetobacteraceae bacterium]|jgi:branched-chain amino acid transport system substrate-binding protein|nr:ABC transporter substrate-binding protein [Acetobacteraceae bacterium]
MRSRLLAALFTAALIAPAMAADSVRGVTDNEIVIGTYTDLSGVTAMWGVNNTNAWRMVFDEANSEGGINGRKIKYIVEDNQYQIPRSVQAANKLINRDGVFMMVANGGTPMNNATMPDQLAKGVPNVFPLTSARSMYEPLHHLKFGLAASYYDQMRAGVKLFVEQHHSKTVCAVSQDTDFGRDVMDGARDQLKAMNMKLAAETLHKPTDTDFSASVARLRDANCDLILVGGIVRDSVQIISAVRKTGWKVDMLGQAASYDEAVAEVPGGVTEGFYSMAPVLYVAASATNPAVKEFAEKYKKLYGKEPNFAAQIGYTAGQLVVLALQKAGKDLTADSFVTGMESIKDWHDIFGSPPMTFSATKHQGSNESFLCVVKDGKWEPVSATPVGY